MNKLIDWEDRSAILGLVDGEIRFLDSSERNWEHNFERAVFFDKAKLFALKQYERLTPASDNLRTI